MPITQRYFRADLRTASGIERAELLPFDSFEAVCRNVFDSMPDMARDLLRKGVDPMTSSYLIHDEDGRLSVEIAFAQLLRVPERRAITRGCDDWAPVMADLRSRSDAAVERIDRASAWMTRLTTQALALGDQLPDASDCREVAAPL